MSNILEVPQQQAIQALIAKGWSVRRISRTMGINRRTVKLYAAAVPKCTTKVITGSVIPDESKCTRTWLFRASVRPLAQGASGSPATLAMDSGTGQVIVVSRERLAL